jgi:FKBP-type peptidyl-prolyl cis-trans isomerase
VIGITPEDEAVVEAVTVDDNSITDNDILNFTEDQLKTEIIESGDCAKGKAGDDEFVTIHFKGYFEDGTPISST